jgi:hypothetical protein
LAFRLLQKLLHNIRSDEPGEKPRVRRRLLRKSSLHWEKFPLDTSTGETTMNAHEPPTIDEWKTLIQAEYREMPGLTLTKPQVRRLWRLEPQVCDQVLEALVSTDFLEHTTKDLYVLASSHRL